MTRSERAWQVLGDVLDPEVPALSVCDLGIVREVIDHGQELEVVLTPTYSGCPATEVIAHSVLSAIEAQGLGPARTTLRRAPAWTTEWISEEGKRKLREYGIAPPGRTPPDAGAPIRWLRRPAVIPAPEGGSGNDGLAEPESIACPHCGSSNTERTSAFGSTACKALYRCLACREPFEYFKPL